MRRSGALDAFAQGDASCLPIQGSTIHHGPKLRRTIWSYRSGTDEKIHLKCPEGVQGGGGEGTCVHLCFNRLSSAKQCATTLQVCADLATNRLAKSLVQPRLPIQLPNTYDRGKLKGKSKQVAP